jgi:hypothetical protein
MQLYRQINTFSTILSRITLLVLNIIITDDENKDVQSLAMLNYVSSDATWA